MKPDREQPGIEILSQVLGFDVRTLIDLIGGPWDMTVDPSIPGMETRLPGLVFIGRAGPSVMIQIFESQVRIGRAKGEWWGPHPLVWDMVDPIETIPLDEIHQRSAQFGEAVEAAYKKKRRTLKICRACGDLNAPELMFGSDECYGCASQYRGIVY